ncbi:MAG: InlB B-repeat-containing protein [Clostridiales bacterium]|nr:InlB B-repeat-containing protein [Clostridiales bacterium]
MKKRLLSIILALALCLGLLPATALATTGSITYLDKDGVEQTYTGEYTVVENYNGSTPVKWGAAGKTTWYVVNSNVNISVTAGYAVEAYGDLHLILMDNCTLTTGPIQNNSSLTIYAQSTGKDTMGTLTATGSLYRAAIENFAPQNSITINGGNIQATGGNGGANEAGGAGIGGHGAIGSTAGYSGGTITINGGNIQATGGDGGANGFADYGGAGIGGGGGKTSGGGGCITINGGTVIATGGSGAAGIGGGANGAGTSRIGDRTITITGGNVTANGGKYGAGIGGGNQGAGSCDGGSINIIGGTVNANGGNDAAGIGGGKNGAGGNITISGTADVTAQGGNAGGNGGGGAGIGGGYYSNGGTINISGGKVTATGGSDSAGIGGGFQAEGGTINISGGTVIATGHEDGAGIGGGSYGAGGTITISGTANVTAKGGSSNSGCGAGIGGGGGLSGAGAGGTITISGGTVKATGGTPPSSKHYGAGIGGGGAGNRPGGAGGNITISGGTVTAISDGNGAGIGGGGGEGDSDSGAFRTTDSGNAIIKASSIADNDNKTGWKGIIFDGSNGGVYGNQSLNKFLTIDSSETLLIGKGSTLTANNKLTNNGAVCVGGTLNGTVSGSLYYPLTVTGGTFTATNTKTFDNVTYVKVGDSVTLTPTPSTGYKFGSWTASPGVTISNNSFTMPNSAVTVTAQTTEMVKITTQPTAQTVTYGTDVFLSITAQNYSGNADGISYRWFKNDTELSGETSNTLSLTRPDAGTNEYYCAVTYEGHTKNSTKVNVTVNRATITVTPDPEQTKVYGNSDPTLTYTYSGAVSNETPFFTGYLSRATGENVGTYAINRGTLKLADKDAFKASNYELKFSSTSVSFTITQAAPTITIKENQSAVYDGAAVTAGTSGADVIYAYAGDGTVTVKWYADNEGVKDSEISAPTTVGTYWLGVSAAASTNYQAVEEVIQKFTITKKPITITAKDQTITYGGNIATTTDQVTATLATGDTLKDITLMPSTGDAPGGTIMPSAATIVDSSDNDVTGNYDITYTSGTLTINKADQSAPAAPEVKEAETSTGVRLEAITTTGYGDVQYAYSTTSDAPTEENAWQTSPDFTGLTKNTQYYFFARYAGDGNHNPSPASAGTPVKTLDTYTVTYDLNNGSGTIPTAQTQDVGANFTAAAQGDITRTGYTFKGWATTNAATDAAYQAGASVSDISADTTLYAVWTINQYTITFDTDGGTAVDAITQDYNTAVTAPADPTKTGYTFAGWDKEIPATMPAENMTIKATWTINQYTITFDTDGGSEIAAITQDYNTTVNAPATPTKTGYTFAGWDKEIPTTMPAENMTIKATWTINQYTITFDTDGGSAVDAITQDYNTTVNAPADPTKTGYTFAGWDKEIPATMPAENVTIKATWTINQYTITFDTDGGTAVDSITQNYGTDVTAPANPTKTGYTFAGWDKDIPETMPAENVTIKAQWTVNTYAVTLNVNSGTIQEGDVTSYTYGVGATLPTKVTKSGYYFVGWYDNEDCIGKAVTEITTTDTGDKTFYAYWLYIPPTDPSITETTENEDGSTTTTVTDKTTGTVTETTTSQPVTDEEGKTTQTVTETVTNKDGSTVETVTETVQGADGSSVETTAETKTDANGVTTSTETVKATDTTGTTAEKVTETNAAGETTTTVEATVSDQAVTQAIESGAPVALPVEVTAAKDAGTAPVVNVEVPASVSAENPVKVEIPVETVTPGTVVFIVNADGSEEIVKTSIPVENGIVLTVEGTVTVKIVDNSKEFVDVQPVRHWAEEAVDFVVARGMFEGTSTTTFDTDSGMTRAMLMTVLARLDGVDTTSGKTWYEKGMVWAVENGISDGTDPEDPITREQLAVMLWRYAGGPESDHSLDSYIDADQISGYALEAMRWANEIGIITGYGNDILGAVDYASRAEVAQMLMNFVKALNL